MLINTPHHKLTCRECAEICAECAKVCKRIGGTAASGTRAASAAGRQGRK
jgi:hypothetical protein